MIRSQFHIGIIGVLPPPVTGMTAVTGFVKQYLSNNFDIKVYNLLPKGKRPQYFWPLIKGLKTITACFKLVTWQYQKDLKVLYYPCNSNFGIFFDILIGVCSKILNFKIIIHHHAYSYINKRDKRMAIFTKLLGYDAIHIFLCKKMKYRFKELYINFEYSLVLKNGFMIKEIATSPKKLDKSNNQEFRIGHISNLDIAKGLDIVLETFEALKSLKYNITFILCGPMKSKREEKILNDFIVKYPNTIDYRGPVYGEKKKQFFEDIHLLLFPTKYLNETYPLVILESFSYGVPVISFDRGCIHDMIDGKCGFLISSEENFTKKAIKYISYLMHSKNLYRRFSIEALKLANKRKKESIIQLNELKKLISANL